MDQPGPETELERAVAGARTAFVAALRAGKPEAAAALYAEDARLLAPSAQVIGGRDAIEAFWRAGLHAGIADVQLEPLELDRQDGAAYEIGRYTLRLAPQEGGSVVDRGSYLLVYRKQSEGRWEWAIESFNPDGPPEHRVMGGSTSANRG